MKTKVSLLIACLLITLTGFAFTNEKWKETEISLPKKFLSATIMKYRQSESWSLFMSNRMPLLI